MLYNLKLIPEIRDKITNWQSNYKLCTGKHIQRKTIIKQAVSMYIDTPVNIEDLKDFIGFYGICKKINIVYFTRDEIQIDKIKTISAELWINYKFSITQNELLNFFINKFINNYKPIKK